MGKKTHLQEKGATKASRVSDNRASGKAPLANWFPAHISRRTMGKGMAWTAALGMAGVSIAKLVGHDEPEVSLDSLDLQKRQGWNVGSTDKTLPYLDGLTATDSQGQARDGIDVDKMISIYQPLGASWQPFFVPTLIQSMAQPSLGAQVRMVVTPAMRETYERAEGLRNLVSQAPNAGQTLIVSDLPGPSSIALGAALADATQLVPVFDNWPHPLGVVHSHETLGAMLYYARDIEAKRAKLGDKAPALLLLDGNRLAAYTDQDTQFDNRYLAKLPLANDLKSRGISNVLYVVKDDAQTHELDDLNDDFVEWQKQGINVRILPMTQFKAYDEPGTARSGSGSTSTSTVVHRHYYYGGSPYSHFWFYNHYAYAPPSRYVGYSGGARPIPRPNTAPPFTPPSYRPVSRPTMFSASRVGGVASGVGKARPSGFGRTSVRMSNGGITGVRSGRSGSYGRSGGGWFGG